MEYILSSGGLEVNIQLLTLRLKVLSKSEFKDLLELSNNLKLLISKGSTKLLNQNFEFELLQEVKFINPLNL